MKDEPGVGGAPRPGRERSTTTESAPALYHDLARFYDRIYARKEYRQETVRLLAIAKDRLRRRPRSLLDVACGTGRHLDEFRRRVPDVAGIDLSREMLRVARARLGPGVRLTAGDMRSFELGRTFDTVVCLFSAFGYLMRRSDRDAALRNFARHMNPGGVVLVEGWIRPSRWRGGRAHLTTYEEKDATIVRLVTTRRAGSRSTLTMHYLVAEPGRPIVHRVEVHHNALVGAEEILGSFRRAGLRASAILSGPYRDRGLYVGVRPVATAPSRARRRRVAPVRRRPTAAGTSGSPD